MAQQAPNAHNAPKATISFQTSNEENPGSTVHQDITPDMLVPTTRPARTSGALYVPPSSVMSVTA